MKLEKFIYILINLKLNKKGIYMAGYIYNLKCLGKLKKEETFLKNDYYMQKFFKEIHHSKRFYKDYLKLNNLEDNKENLKKWSNLNITDILNLYLTLLLNLKDTNSYKEWAEERKYSIKNLNNVNSLNEMKWNYDYSINVFKDGYNVLEFGVEKNIIKEFYQNWDLDKVQTDIISDNRKTKNSIEVENSYNKFIDLVRYGIIAKTYEYSNTKYLLDLEESKLEEIYIKFSDSSYIKIAKIDKKAKFLYNSNLIEIDNKKFEQEVIKEFNLEKCLTFIQNNIELNINDKPTLKKILFLIKNKWVK